ncbi:MAG: U32 family peptidase [Treponema sp.]|jgi:putative protease|nr:U32 family peptidase [Treponema sp.]
MVPVTRTIELLAPAGSPEALDAAIGEGADAVYLGLKNFNARMRSANFTYSQFEGALRAFRRMGKKLYVTVNTVFEQREADRMYQFLKYLAAAGPDALIVQDFGVIAMSRSEFPALKLHASTQMNIASSPGANVLSKHGVSRVVLARELSLTELRSLRNETNLELEVFVHGALCVSASGLCLFSSYLGGKSANRGMCTQACRRLYRRGAQGGIAPESGYYFSPADLQLLERLPDLAAAGINAFKIEGRMKSAGYVGAVVSAYRLVLDAIAAGDEEQIRRSIQKGRDILRNDFARSKTRFYFDMAPAAAPGALPEEGPAVLAASGIDSWLNPARDGGAGISLGAILKTKHEGDKRQGLVFPGDFTNFSRLPATGDTIRLHRSDDSGRVSHKLQFAGPAARDEHGYWISIPEGFETGDRVYLIQIGSLAKRYKPVIPRNAPDGGRAPGRDKAPFPHIQKPQKKAGNGGREKRAKPAKPGGAFPEGLYVALSRIEDLYITQSSRPVKVMLTLSRKNAAFLLADTKPSLPFKPAEIILVLDPFFPQDAVETTSAKIRRLIKQGYRQFVLNNPGHFPLFRGSDDRGADIRQQVLLIAGPWLYMFNAWSLSFVSSLGADGFVSPLENNRQNLERTLNQGERDRSSRDGLPRSAFFVPVFAWPSLFRIRADIGAMYDFDTFSDSRHENFRLVSGPGGSLVIPEKPFSITDKIPFLREAGFSRFIIDLSGPVLKKGNYRDLMWAVKEGVPLPHAGRFNWKDGFYQPAE